MTVCRSQRYQVVDCSTVKQQPQRTIGLQQLNTANGGHRANQRVMIADVVWMVCQTNGPFQALKCYHIIHRAMSRQ